MAAAPDQNPEGSRPYEACPSCGRLVSHHIPEQGERDLYGVVPGINIPGVGLCCGLACLYLKNPGHAVFRKMAPGSLDYDLQQIKIAQLEAQLKELKGAT